MGAPDLRPEMATSLVGEHLNSELVYALGILFPDRCPGPDESIDRIRYTSGQRSVVNFLQGILDQRDESFDLAIEREAF
jgi:hypothetical protein